MVHIEKVSEETFRDVIRLKVAKKQENYVAENVCSLAQAWLYDEARPFAVLDDDTVVGFLMLDWDEDERTVGIWRFMIGEAYQRKGYGREAIRLAIEMIKETGYFDLIHLDYVEGNRVARELYASFGFRENGEIEDGEIVMTLPITDTPRVGMLPADEEDVEQLLGYLTKDGEAGFPSEKEMRKAAKEKRMTRFTLYGETIGIVIDGHFRLRKKFASYETEAKEVYAKKSGIV